MTIAKRFSISRYVGFNHCNALSLARTVFPVDKIAKHVHLRRHPLRMSQGFASLLFPIYATGATSGWLFPALIFKPPALLLVGAGCALLVVALLILIFAAKEESSAITATPESPESPISAVVPEVASASIVSSRESSPQPVLEPEHVHRRYSGYRTPIKILAYLCVIAAVGFGLLYSTQIFSIPTNSMEPTLQPGDKIFVNKLSQPTTPGSIIVFQAPPAATRLCVHSEGDWVKRIVASGGQTIWSVGRTIYVDGKRLAQPYLPKGYLVGPQITRITVPKNDVYVMGDNRNDSCDSRLWGPLPDKDIVGRVVAIIWHDGHPDLHFFSTPSGPSSRVSPSIPARRKVLTGLRL